MDMMEQHRLNTGCQQLEDLLARLENVLRQMEGCTAQANLPDTPAPTQPTPTPPDPASPPTLACYCFGPFRAFQDDQPVADWNGHKGQLILKYLLVQAGKAVAKEKLMEAIWPETEPEAARRNLHQAIYSIRHTLKANNADTQYILFRNESYLLNPAVSLWVDFMEFEKYAQQGRLLENRQDTMAAMEAYATAEGLFQGNFLQDEPYEEWAELKRNQLQNLYLDIADKLSQHYFREQQYRAAIFQCQRILEVDNCHEPAYRILMQCHLRQGQRHLAVKHYQTCVQALRETLGLSPAETTRQVYQQLIIS